MPLWFVVAVHEYLVASGFQPSEPRFEPEPVMFEFPTRRVAAAPEPGGRTPPSTPAATRSSPPSRPSSRLPPGTRYGIRADSDGLLACGEPGVQLTLDGGEGR
jgi:hypothetical protein